MPVAAIRLSRRADPAFEYILLLFHLQQILDHRTMRVDLRAKVNANPFRNAVRKEMEAQLNYNSRYTDIMIYRR